MTLRTAAQVATTLTAGDVFFPNRASDGIIVQVDASLFLMPVTSNANSTDTPNLVGKFSTVSPDSNGNTVFCGVNEVGNNRVGMPGSGEFGFQFARTSGDPGPSAGDELENNFVAGNQNLVNARNSLVISAGAWIETSANSGAGGNSANTYNTILGGTNHYIKANAYALPGASNITIVGGTSCTNDTQGSSASNSFFGNNFGLIEGAAARCTIVGGGNTSSSDPIPHQITSHGGAGTFSAGMFAGTANQINAANSRSTASVILGGGANEIESGYRAAILVGDSNTIRDVPNDAVILGGQGNLIDGATGSGVISSEYSAALADHSTVVGGRYSRIGTASNPLIGQNSFAFGENAIGLTDGAMVQGVAAVGGVPAGQGQQAIRWLGRYYGPGLSTISLYPGDASADAPDGCDFGRYAAPGVFTGNIQVLIFNETAGTHSSYSAEVTIVFTATSKTTSSQVWTERVDGIGMTTPIMGNDAGTGRIFCTLSELSPGSTFRAIAIYGGVMITT